jgi:hypothetical protein
LKPDPVNQEQGVTKRCRLSWLTKCGGGGLSHWVQLYTGAQVNFGDLTPYLTYDQERPPGTAHSYELLQSSIICRNKINNLSTLFTAVNAEVLP